MRQPRFPSRPLWLLIILLSSLPFLLAAQTASGCSEAAGGTTRCTLAINVLDETGRPIRGLSAASFRGRLDSTTAKILTASLDTKPRRVLFMLDTGPFIAYSEENSKIARLAVEEVSKNLPISATIRLLTFGPKLEGKFELREVDPAIGRMLHSAFAGKLLPEAILTAVSELQPGQLGDSLMIITDHGAERGKKFTQVQRALSCSGVRLYAFVFRTYIRDRSLPVGAGYLSNVRELADASGGEALELSTEGIWSEGYNLRDKELAALQSKLRRLSLQMSELYSLEIELPVTLEKARNWKLEVVDGHGKKMKGVRVLYPRRLEPCQALTGPLTKD